MNITQSEKKAFIVLGPPRSGTSMTAGILNMFGVNMGNIREPDAQNPKGYFEDRDIHNLQDDIIKACGKNYNGFNPPPIGKLLNKGKTFNSRISQLMSKKAADSKVWGWKTIYTNITIRLFLPYLENPNFIVVFRNPIKIAQSQIKYTTYKSYLYDEISLFDALKLTNFYYEQILTFLSEYNSLSKYFISYEDLIEDPKRELTLLANFLGLQYNYAEVKKYISSSKQIRFQKILWLFHNYFQKKIFNHTLIFLRHPIRAFGKFMFYIKNV